MRFAFSNHHKFRATWIKRFAILIVLLAAAMAFESFCPRLVAVHGLEVDETSGSVSGMTSAHRSIANEPCSPDQSCTSND